MTEFNEAERATSGDPVRSSHVLTSLGEVDDATDGLLASIHQLEKRLVDVLRPEADADKAMVGVPRETLVPLAERLTNHAGSVRMARQYIHSMLERLEL